MEFFLTLASTLISIQNLYKFYGSFPALNGVTFDVPYGVSGLVGANGAGKTTLLKILLGLVSPSSGSANILGVPINAKNQDTIRQQIGYMSELDTFLPDITGKKFIAHLGQMSGLTRTVSLQRAHNILTFVGLEERHRKIKTYSKGMKQKLKLAMALIHSPKLLLLDEPTDGLDPEGRNQMLNVINKLYIEYGISVVISSHILPDIERIGTYLIVLHKGKLLIADDMSRLLHKLKNTLIVTFNADEGTSKAFAKELANNGLQCSFNRYDQLEIVNANDLTFSTVMNLSKSMKINIEFMNRHRLNLEDVFTDLFHDEETKQGYVVGR